MARGMQLKETSQMHVVILNRGRSKKQMGAQIEELGGALLADIGQECSLLATLSLDQALELAKQPGVRLVAPVGMSHQVRRLQVPAGPDGQPLWEYEVRDNAIVRADSDFDDPPSD